MARGERRMARKPATKFPYLQKKLQKIKNQARQAATGFTLHFGPEPFEGADAELTWLRSGDPEVLPGKDGSASQNFGNWYKGIVAGQEMEGWLCPALGLYFKTAPKRIFVMAEPLHAGVDPIWHIDKDAPDAFRFVSAPQVEG